MVALNHDIKKYDYDYDNLFTDYDRDEEKDNERLKRRILRQKKIFETLFGKIFQRLKGSSSIFDYNDLVYRYKNGLTRNFSSFEEINK